MKCRLKPVVADVDWDDLGDAMKYRKKPIVVVAEQWFPDKDVAGVFVEPGMSFVENQGGLLQVLRESNKHYVVTIHNQRAYLEPGDFVITEPNGKNHYPCKPDIFHATYEAVE